MNKKEQRLLNVALTTETIGYKYLEKMLKEYRKTAKNINAIINSFYANHFIRDESEQMEEFNTILKGRELKALQRNFIKKYDAIMESDYRLHFDVNYKKELRLFAGRRRITSLESLQAEIRYEIESLYALEHARFEEMLEDAYYTSFFYGAYTFYELEKNLKKIKKPDKKDFGLAIIPSRKKPVSGNITFTDSLKIQKQRVLTELETTVARSMRNKASVTKTRKTTTDLSRDSKPSSPLKKYYNNLVTTTRLYLTRVLTGAQKLVMDLMGIKKYQYFTMGDERVCEFCLPLHEQIFYLKDAIEGINLPPMHSNCRCMIDYIPVTEAGAEEVIGFEEWLDFQGMADENIRATMLIVGQKDSDVDPKNWHLSENAKK